MSHVAHFLADPLPRVPVRRPGSLRRTSSVDMVVGADGGLTLLGRARDPDGTLASCQALVGRDRLLATLEVQPRVPGSDGLIGRLVGRGFRAAVDGLCAPGTLGSVLLCELPVAALLSGYGTLYTGRFPSPMSDEFLAGLPVDICAGWASSASMVVRIRDERSIPTPGGPVSPGDGTPDDELHDDELHDDELHDDDDDGSVVVVGNWHAMPPLAPDSMRRQRLIERHGTAVWAMFRDSYARPDGVVTILHEYSVSAALTDDGSRIASCVATPRVLPWAECPSAAASAQRIVGQPVSDLRALVRDELVGTSTCTHLNDLLSSLSQVDHLVSAP